MNNEIEIGNIVLDNEIEIGEIVLDVRKVYPELENLEITPSGKEQKFNHPNSYGYDEITVKAIKIKEHYLDNKNLILVFNDNSKLSIDISEYIGEVTDEKINAIKNMKVYIEDGNLIFEYDDEILKLNFSLENGDLIVENSMTGLDFNINENGELEAIY